MQGKSHKASSPIAWPRSDACCQIMRPNNTHLHPMFVGLDTTCLAYRPVHHSMLGMRAPAIWHAWSRK
eukprot:5741065-Pyramimonas_sp.AAC.1